MRRFLHTLFIILFLFPVLHAQVTTVPAVVTESGAVDIIFDASQGNKGLMGYTGDVYAHTGVITNLSTSGSDWKYAPAWGDNSAKYKLTSLGSDKWKLTISPDVRSWYGVPSGEQISKLAFVFRSADKTKEGKAVGGADIFVTLNESVFTPTAPVVQARPANVKDGINYLNDNSVTLVLYAPGKSHVHLMGDFNNWTKDNAWQLFKDGDYWWITVNNLEKGKEYAFQYLVDNSLKIADAYCEKILDPSNDSYIPASVYPNLKSYPNQTDGIVSILQTGKTGYTWTATDFIAPPADQLVIYELLVRDFTTEGTIKAVTAKLDYLKSLGVNAIELMPVQEFDGNDSWGYNPCFYFAPDKAYGTEADYKEFIDEAHKRGIAVILDIVFNHATGNHPFAKLYWEGSATAPNNPWFNVTAPHPYSVFHDFNHAYSGTREYFKRVLEHWLKEYKLDGFRFDLSKGFTQNSSTEQTASNYDASRIAILKDYNSKIKSVNPKAYTILEHFCVATEELELVQDGMMVWANANNAFCQGIMGYSSQSDFSSLSAQSRQWNLKGMIGYQESHDEERTVYKAKTYGVDGVKNSTQVQMERAGMNAAFLFTIPGPKMIWQFGEMGYDYSIDYNGRVGKKPVKWDYLENPDRAKLADTYATLLSLRNEFPQVFANPSTEMLRVSESYWSNGRFITLQHPDLNVVLAGNYTTSATSVTLPFTQTGTWYDLFTGESYVVDNLSNPVNVTLPGSSFKLLTSKKTLTDSEPISMEKPVVVYPNPTNGFIQFSDSAPKRVTLYNTLGRQVLQQQVTDGTLNIGNLPAGPYFMQVYTAGKMESLTILKR
ncbi:alpha-amylase family glycosyl hydrolase [Macellibacteroides fermentans]|uniref:alpha-amylase family glycosyl hydrolase n=1 Tax=Macellibacteroides fermentans TaxID=879969 RepID=UPI002B3C6E9E|nr:alpha-amylase family glycosyl hydrolase [Macellibacteroides fermentans]